MPTPDPISACEATTNRTCLFAITGVGPGLEKAVDFGELTMTYECAPVIPCFRLVGRKVIMAKASHLRPASHLGQPNMSSHLRATMGECRCTAIASVRPSLYYEMFQQLASR